MATENTNPSASTPSAKVAAPSVEATAPLGPSERISRADAVIRRNVLWGFGAGILPLPLFDLVAATAVQVKMIKALSDVYGVPFREDLVKKLLASLLSGVVGVGVGTAIALSFGKLIPFVGQAVGIVMVPVTIGAITHATGKVFVMHFEAGGTLLDFDPHAMRAHFKQEFADAKDLVTKLFEEENSKAGKRPS
jgi:uncharacterized protein (DUF697 family)